MVNNFNQLFYKDSYQKTFATKVIDSKTTKNKHWLAFEETCFYPLGGGQPGDQGYIQNLGTGQNNSEKITVLDTVWNQGKIWHHVSKLIPVDTKILGEINFERRFDLMQQHSGEHIVSGIINREYGYENVGFHINEVETTFDFDGDLTWEQIEKLELEANQAVLENIPIEIHYLDQASQKNWNYRSKLDLDDEIRIVHIPGYDTCACAGTHVRSTAEIGPIKIVDRESYKGGVRLTVLCGNRSLKYFQKLQNTVRESGALLSANIDSLADAIKKKEIEVIDLNEKINQKNNELIELILENNKLEKNIVLENPSFDKKEWNYVSSKIAENIDGFVAFIIKQSENRHLLYLRSEQYNLKKHIEMFRTEINFKGGGNENLLQGPVLGDLQKIKDVLNNIN
ncbi:MAG: alanyl-tRNA editing protein [Clostridiaceae bacterium]|nr:alanyl-tRNA editing protein [Clostridiaceae bacterium]